MFHGAHHQKMTQPFVVLIVGIVGIFVNFVAFIVIGGKKLENVSFIIKVILTDFNSTKATQNSNEDFSDLIGPVRTL